MENGSERSPFHAYARLLDHHRGLFVGFVAAATLLCGFGITKVRFDDNPRNIFKRGGEDFERLEAFARNFGSDDSEVAVLVSGDGLYSSEAATALEQFVGFAESLDEVREVLHLGGSVAGGAAMPFAMPALDAPPEAFEAAFASAREHPLSAGQLLSGDGRHMLVIVHFDPEIATDLPRLAEPVNELREVAEARFGALGLETMVAGHIAVRLDNLANLRREFFGIMAVGALLSTLVAAALFRRALAVAAAFLTSAASVVWTLGLLGWLGADIDVISTSLPTLVFVLSFAASVHLLMEIHSQQAGGAEPRAASTGAVGLLGLPCCLTALTTAIGFGSLALARTSSVQSFGLNCAVGIGMTLLANLTVLPLIAGCFRWPPRAGARDRRGRLLDALGGHVVAHSTKISIAGAALCALLIAAALRLGADVAWTEMLPEDSETVLAVQRLDTVFGGSLTAAAVIAWDEGREPPAEQLREVAEGIKELIASEPTFAGALSYLDLIDSLPEPGATMVRKLPVPELGEMLRSAPGQWVGANGREVAVIFKVPDAGAATLRPLFEDIDRGLAEITAANPGLRIHLTGTSVSAARNVTMIIEDLGRSLAFASLTVFLIITIGVRSFTLGLLSILPNAFPLLLNAGLLALAGRPLQFASVVTFSICLGIAVNDTIHFLSRFQHERRLGGEVADAVRRTMRCVGIAMITTTLVVCSGFASALLSEMPAVQLFGGLSCLALAAALLGDLFILPAMLVTFLGRRPSRRG